jgi:hypothetical protein
VHLPDDLVAINQHPGFKQRRQRQLGGLTEQLARLPVRQFIDPHDLHGEIVGAAALISLLDDHLGSRIQVGGAIRDGVHHKARSDMGVNAISRQHEHISLLDLQHTIVDLDLRIDAERAAQIALLG